MKALLINRRLHAFENYYMLYQNDRIFVCVYSYSFDNEKRNGTYLPRFSASDHPFSILKLFGKRN